MRVTQAQLCMVASMLLIPAVLPAQGAREASGHAVFVSRDAMGRIQRQATRNADGSQHVVANVYWPQSTVVEGRVTEDLDSTGLATHRTTEKFDTRARILERRDVAIDAAGKERGTLSRFHYDTQGHGSHTTFAVVP